MLCLLGGPTRCGGGTNDEEQEDESECGDTPASRLTQRLLMETVPQRTVANRRRPDAREYRCVVDSSFTFVSMAVVSTRTGARDMGFVWRVFNPPFIQVAWMLGGCTLFIESPCHHP